MTQEANRWAGRIGRAGYAARAGVYCLIGAVALDAVRRFDPTEPSGIVGALHKLAAQPGGRLLLGLLALGLAAQVAWRGVQALSNIERPHGQPPRWWTRLGWGCIGGFYASLLLRAVGFLLHHDAEGAAQNRSMLRRVLAFPAGRTIVFGVAAGLVIFGFVELYKAWRAPFLADFDRRALTPARRLLLRVVGGVGLVGRGLVFGAGGILLWRSAWRARPDTVDAGDVLRQLFAGRFGQPLVAAIAIGLFAYAALMIFEAAWRRNVRAPRL